MTLKMKHYFCRSSTRETQSIREESQFVFQMRSDTTKHKYNLQPSYMIIFPSRESWICGSKAPVDVQGLVWFTTSSGMKEGNEARIYGLRTMM
jgi:hypothetical protein